MWCSSVGRARRDELELTLRGESVVKFERLPDQLVIRTWQRLSLSSNLFCSSSFFSRACSSKSPPVSLLAMIVMVDRHFC